MPIAEGGPEVEVPAMPELAQFVLPLMQGSVHQISDLRFQTSVADYTGSLTLIARRSAQRPGVRHWRRGAEPTVSRPALSTCLSVSDMGAGGSMRQHTRQHNLTHALREHFCGEVSCRQSIES